MHEGNSILAGESILSAEVSAGTIARPQRTGFLGGRFRRFIEVLSPKLIPAQIGEFEE